MLLEMLATNPVSPTDRPVPEDVKRHSIELVEIPNIRVRRTLVMGMGGPCPITNDSTAFSSG